MNTAPVCSLEDLSALFRRKRIGRYLARLIAGHGFPAPLPGAKPKLWSRAAVERWLADPAGAALAPANDAVAPAELEPAFHPQRIAEARARLEQRYGVH